jgi:O-antigen/teichoic acid export membrane protein
VVASGIAALYILTLPGPVLQTVATRFASLAAARGPGESLRPLMNRIAILSVGLGAMVALLLVLFQIPAARFLQISDTRVVYVLALATVAALVVSGNRGVLLGMRRFLDTAVNAALDSVTRVATAALLIGLGAGAVGAVFGVVMGPALAYAHSLVLLRAQKGGTTGVGFGYAEVGRYALPAAAGVIGVTFLFNADVVLAKHYLAPELAGIYAAGSVLARVVYFLGVTIAGVMFPEVATLHARDEAHFHVVDRSLLFLGGIAVVFVAGYTLLPSLVLIPYGSSFGPVKPYLGPFAVALSLLSISNLLVNYFLSINSARFVIPMVLACTLEVVLITLFHSDPGQVLEMMLIAMATLAGLLMALYLKDRLSLTVPAAPQDPRP